MAAGIAYDQVLASPRVQAFLRVIRFGETSATDPQAYRAQFGWKSGSHFRTFSSFADHPREAFQFTHQTRGLLWTSASGAYQAMCAVPNRTRVDTWGDFVRSEGPHDFSPLSQDKFAVWCLNRRHALQDVLDGNIEQAIFKCALEWASFPGNDYGQGGKSLQVLLNTYDHFLQAGVGPDYPMVAPTPQVPADPPAVAPSRPVAAPSPSPWSSIMPIAQTALTMTNPLLGLAFTAITDVVPKLLDLFKGESAVAARNVEAVKTVVESVKAATGAVNEQDLIEKIQSKDPAVIAAVQEGVKQVYYDIEVKLDGVVAARQAFAPAGTPFYKTGPFWITILLLLPVYYVTHNVMQDLTEKNHDLRLMVVTAFISGVLFSIAGFWLGTSMSSQRKTELSANAAAQAQSDQFR